jgi:glycine/D-amino acid oxidase-like deaminating enzyme
MPSPDPALASVARRVLWQEQTPELPDRAARELPDAVDVVVVGGGYTGVAAARQLARQGATVALIEAERLGFGASTRNGGIVHPGYKLSGQALIRRFGEEMARTLYLESLAACTLVKELIAGEQIEAEWVDGGHVELAYAPAHAENLEAEQAAVARLGGTARVISRDRLHDDIGSEAYYGGLAIEGGGGLHPARYFAGLVAAAERAGAELHEGVRARRLRPQADGRSLVQTDRGGILARDVLVATNGYTNGFVPSLRRRIIPIGSYIIATELLPEEVARSLSPRGRVFFDTKNFLYYWRVTADRRLAFGGRASFIPTSVDRTAAILLRGMLEVYPQLAGVRIANAWGGNVGFTFDRMPHVGRLARVTYAMGYCGSGIALGTYLGTRAAEWLGGAPAPALARLGFPLVPAPYEGKAWFLPLAGEWYRLKDRLAARTRG